MTAPVLSIPTRVLRSITPGRRPGDGIFRALTEGELFLNTADLVLCYLSSAGDLKTIPFANLATLTDVTTAINNLIAGAPGALNTLKELADAIGDDANYAASITTALGNRLRFDASQTMTTGQQAQALQNLGLDSSVPVPNPVINAAMNLFQQRTNPAQTLYTNVAVGGPKPQYTADGWLALRGAYAAGLQISQQIGFLGFANCARIQRAADDTSVNSIFFRQIMEKQDCIALAGQTVTLSFFLRKGADLSATNVVLAVETGTGTDEGSTAWAASSWAGLGSQSVNIASSIISPTGARYSATFVIPSGATEMAYGISLAPVGTAFAADYLDVTGAQIDIGPIAGAYYRRQRSEELMRAQRYYELVSSVYTADMTSGTGYNKSEPYAVNKRIVAPTFVALSQAGSGVGNVGTRIAGALSTRAMTITGTAASTGPAHGWADLWGVSAEL